MDTEPSNVTGQSNGYKSIVFTPDNLFKCSVEDIFAELVKRGNGGTTVRSAASPALSTQFVRSELANKATASVQGAFSEIIYPKEEDLIARHSSKHGEALKLAYVHTHNSGILPAGFGERSAKALAREESTYQLKGVFPTAALSFAKLRARIEARDGDVHSLDAIFATMWGLEDGAVMAIPRLHIDGTEATRMSAMEDRAYHALSGHPGHHGGYRVDTVTLAPDALGEGIPLNWARIRTGLKSIALMQVQGDLSIAQMIAVVRAKVDVKFTMGIVSGSQMAYIRPLPWEIYMSRMLDQSLLETRDEASGSSFSELGVALSMTAQESIAYRILKQPDMVIEEDVKRIARTVSRMSNAALRKTVITMLSLDTDRALIQEPIDLEYSALAKSRLSANFIVPRYKLTTTGLTRGVTIPFIGHDSLPDMSSHGKLCKQLDLREFREACLTVPIDIPGALNVAVYMTVMNPQVQMYAYMLMRLVKPPESSKFSKTAIRLREESLYNSLEVRQLGNQLFSDIFMNTFELLLRSLAAQDSRNEVSVKMALWTYLSQRCRERRPCPFPGGWKDLIFELRTCAEGWTLYYWVRVTIGRKHFQMNDGLFAPVAAGEVSDFLSLMKRSVRSKAQSWALYYSGSYKVIEARLEEERKRTRKTGMTRRDAPDGIQEESSTQQSKYIPPHLRSTVDLEQEYDANEILSRSKKYTAEQYQKMVEMQSKSKFFAAINVMTSGSQITVGISDEKMLEMLVEFYQARWYSLHVRIEKAKTDGKVFSLGQYKFSEHPWGELRTELPTRYYDMLMFMSELDPRAWTIHPEFLQQKLRKSLSELWDDVSEEIVKITAYIHDVCEGLAEEQEEIDVERGIESAMRSMIGVPAIPLPTFGYVHPYRLPAKTMDITASTSEVSTSVRQSGTAFTTSDSKRQDEEPEEYLELEELEDGDEEELDLASFTMAHHDSSLEAQKVEYLSLRGIWHIIGLPTETDERMRLTVGAASDYDIDGPHLDDKIGPVMLRGEENLVRKRWKRVEAMITHRLGMIDIRPVIDDM